MQAFGRHSSDRKTPLVTSLDRESPSESDIKAHAAEAVRLYQRGVAAARGGQRRMAVGLLTRSVQLDPRNERAWLWLSGVLDDPHQIAFCLNSVLKLNPTNERAQKGLRWLEERQLLNDAPSTASALNLQVDAPAESAAPREQSESWWINWRHSRREIHRTRLVLWGVPIVLLCCALVLHQAFAGAVAENNAPAVAPAVLSVAVMSEREQAPTPVPVLESETSSIREVRLISYMSTLEPLRQQLRNAVDSYRNATGQPGGASVGHVSAARTYRSHVEQAHTTLENVTPPQSMQASHEDYMRGLELELEAIDAMLEFYSSYDVGQANRAALRFQEANTYYGRARSALDTVAHHAGLSTTVSVHTPR